MFLRQNLPAINIIQNKRNIQVKADFNLNYLIDIITAISDTVI